MSWLLKFAECKKLCRFRILAESKPCIDFLVWFGYQDSYELVIDVMNHDALISWCEWQYHHDGPHQAVLVTAFSLLIRCAEELNCAVIVHFHWDQDES
jgi:hypothetical protein